MPPPRLTKRQQARAELENAQISLAKALSLLGGRTRQKPKLLTHQFTVRQYIESMQQRCAVSVDLLVILEHPIGRADDMFNNTTGLAPRDSVESEHEQNHRPTH